MRWTDERPENTDSETRRPCGAVTADRAIGGRGTPDLRRPPANTWWIH